MIALLFIANSIFVMFMPAETASTAVLKASTGNATSRIIPKEDDVAALIANHTKALNEFADYDTTRPDFEVKDPANDADVVVPTTISMGNLVPVAPVQYGHVPDDSFYSQQPLGSYPQQQSPYGSNSPQDPDYDSYVGGGRQVFSRPALPTQNNNFGYGNTRGYTPYNSSPLGYSYAGYIHRQARRYPIMMYTLVQCVPCQRAKHLLAVSYGDVAAHFLELRGDEDWQRQLQVDLQRITRQITFPYIFICGQHIGGSSDLFNLHQSGQLRTMLNNCRPHPTPAPTPEDLQNVDKPANYQHPYQPVPNTYGPVENPGFYGQHMMGPYQHQQMINYGYGNGYHHGYTPYNPPSLGFSYTGYIQKQARRYPFMMYTLVQCAPCQQAKHLLASSYSSIAAHFLELRGDEAWQRQMLVDLPGITRQSTFPYVFVCGQFIGGSSALFTLHQSGKLRTMLTTCRPRESSQKEKTT
ncbi:unnamed protein product [Caenorhabditis auriculariae]|uniref:Glutaredoxin domain-containing protein n=1 Tax=Caenorhabditis auriculariae TaxID=2777116 RepID=A0A8S1HMN9_9PELO|nr:unnamed protein product [Caenorhabditis auriculariae]